jgi:prophage regulatory protein
MSIYNLHCKIFENILEHFLDWRSILNKRTKIFCNLVTNPKPQKNYIVRKQIFYKRGGNMEIESLRIIKLPEVLALTGLSRTSVYEQMNAGTFPMAIKLSKRSVGWYESEVQEWIKRLPRTKDA